CILQPLNVVTWSPCGQYIIAGSIDGCIVAWNVGTKACLERVKHEKGFTICALAWHPKLPQVAYTDNEGNLGLLENVCQGAAKSVEKTSAATTKDYDALFDEDGDDEDFLNTDMIDHQASVGDEEEEDDNFGPVSGRARIRAILDDDDNSLDVPSLKSVGVEKPDGVRRG
ncbi:unnamed protein product, partial [Staurois parvus]